MVPGSMGMGASDRDRDGKNDMSENKATEMSGMDEWQAKINDGLRELEQEQVDHYPALLATIGARDALATELEQLKYGIAAVAFALDWTDLKGVSLEEYARSLRIERDALQANMNLRDDFLVEKGLWGEFVDSLNRSEKK